MTIPMEILKNGKPYTVMINSENYYTWFIIDNKATLIYNKYAITEYCTYDQLHKRGIS